MKESKKNQEKNQVPSIQMGTRLLTANEVAQYLGKTQGAIYMMVARGQLPFLKLGNEKHSSIRFKSDDIEAWVESKIVDAYACK